MPSREPAPTELGLIVYKSKRVATVKRAFRRIGTELGLMGFSQYSFRHLMADQIKKLVPECAARAALVVDRARRA